jgi:hypothetical protein
MKLSARHIPSWLTVLGMVASILTTASPAQAYSSYLTRAPYLTDLTSSSVRVNFGTTIAIVKTRLKYGRSSGGSCTANSATANSTGKQGYTINYPTGSGSATATGNQWKSQLSGLVAGTYCYRMEGTTSSSSTTFVDLMGSSTASPTFSVGGATSFAVIGDWGQSGSTAPGYLNAGQANVISQLSRSGSKFAVSTGDIGYPAGTQTTYGDLLHTGPSVSAIFGPRYWPVAGKSLPMYPVPGNHGFSSTFTSLWPSSSVAATSGGKAANGTYSVNGAAMIAPDYWYAFNVAGWRIYVLTAAWSDIVTSGSNPYAEDYKRHWAPGAPERTWLAEDLAANVGKLKITVMHYPLYSAVRTGDSQDTYLTAPPDGSQSVEKLLASHNVKLVLNGHSHIYQRNNVHNGLVSIVSGGGGAALSPVDASPGGLCSQRYADTAAPVVAVARGWSSVGSACNGAAKPTSSGQVFHYLQVSLTTTSATVRAIDSNGSTFDTVTLR